MKKVFLFIALAIFGLLSCGDREETPAPIPSNYILKDGVYYELTGGKLKAGIFDGGPNYYAAVYLSGNNVNYVDNYDDPRAFSGTGNGLYVNIITPNYLSSGSFTLTEGFAGFNNFNFSIPYNDLDNPSNWPVNLLDLEDRNIDFEKIDENTYKIKMVNSDFELYYRGPLEMLP